MPWQSAPALGIIGGAFFVTGLGLVGVDYLAYGRVRAASLSSLTFTLARNILLILKTFPYTASQSADRRVYFQVGQARCIHEGMVSIASSQIRLFYMYAFLERGKALRGDCSWQESETGATASQVFPVVR